MPGGRPPNRLEDEKFQLTFWTQRVMLCESGCWLFRGGPNGGGYGQITINGKNMQAHRVAYILANGPIDDGLDVLHRCDVKMCCNPSHLYAGTDTDNARDRVQRHKQPRLFGEENGVAKLSDEEALAILNAGIRRGEAAMVADAHGVCGDTIRNILRGKTYTHLPRTEQMLQY